MNKKEITKILKTNTKRQLLGESERLRELKEFYQHKVSMQNVVISTAYNEANKLAGRLIKLKSFIRTRCQKQAALDFEIEFLRSTLEIEEKNYDINIDLAYQVIRDQKEKIQLYQLLSLSLTLVVIVVVLL